MSPDERFWFHRGRHEERARILAEGRARFARVTVAAVVEGGIPAALVAAMIADWLREIEQASL